MVGLEDGSKETEGAFHAVCSRIHRRVDRCRAWHGERRRRRPSARNGVEQGALSRPACWLAIGTANIAVTVPTAFTLPRSWFRPWSCRNRLRWCRPWWSSCSRLSWCRRRVRQAAANIATETANTASTRATTGPISTEAVTRISTRRGLVLEVILDLLDQQAPGLVLARACRLLHGDLQIAELALDLLARQHMQAAR
jgi:hypothetical protein